MPLRLSLHICFRAQGIRWRLHDDYDVQVWTSSHELLTTLPGRLMRPHVELHLATASLQSEVMALVRKPVHAILPHRGASLESRASLRRDRRSRRTVKMRTLILCIAFLSAGCQLYWTRPNATYDDFVRDHTYCVEKVG